MAFKRFLFVSWEGGGNLSPALAVVHRLVERGHAVRFLGEPCNREEIEATGSAFVSYVHAPHRDNKLPESDFIRDWEARTPFEAFARTRQRLMFGQASAYAQDVLEELAQKRWVMVVHVIIDTPRLRYAHYAVEGSPASVSTYSMYASSSRRAEKSLVSLLPSRTT
jgi:hypothetical protein